MRLIDLAAWPRRQHFEMFNAFDYPHFGLCAALDITALYPAVQASRQSLTAALTYLLAQAANRQPEFRLRIRRAAGGAVQVVEHETVHPSITVLDADDLFSFCTVAYTPAFPEFAARLAGRMAAVQAQRVLEDDGRDDLLFMTSLPWVSFTAIQHPIHMHPPDSTPRIAWGRFAAEGGRLRLPLAVQAHHALLDGLHVARFYEAAQALANSAPAWLAA